MIKITSVFLYIPFRGQEKQSEDYSPVTKKKKINFKLEILITVKYVE